MSIPPPRELSSDERNWGMLCHLAALAGWIGLHLGAIFGPLIIWLIKKNDYPFVDDQGKESLNFQISVLIYTIIIAILVVAALIIAGIKELELMIPISMGAGFLLAGMLALFDLIEVIVAAIAASNGKLFRYPMNLRLIK